VLLAVVVSKLILPSWVLPLLAGFLVHLRQFIPRQLPHLLENSIRFEDALGRVEFLPYKYFRHWEVRGSCTKSDKAKLSVDVPSHAEVQISRGSRAIKCRSRVVFDSPCTKTRSCDQSKDLGEISHARRTYQYVNSADRRHFI
jgi:hypothetical protein